MIHGRKSELHLIMLVGQSQFLPMSYNNHQTKKNAPVLHSVKLTAKKPLKINGWFRWHFLLGFCHILPIFRRVIPSIIFWNRQGFPALSRRLCTTSQWRKGSTSSILIGCQIAISTFGPRHQWQVELLHNPLQMAEKLLVGLPGVISPYTDVSKNSGTPKWMVYNGKPGPY